MKTLHFFGVAVLICMITAFCGIRKEVAANPNTVFDIEIIKKRGTAFDIEIQKSAVTAFDLDILKEYTGGGKKIA